MTQTHVDLSDFKEIPHFTNYMASSDGRVYCKNGFFPSTSTFPTSKGFYITCSVVRDSDGIRQDIVIHRLIALAYHYPGEHWEILDVNHKDGDKTNNKEDNLEWCTKGENLKHAYDTGLRKDHRQFLLYDGNNDPIVCKSINDIAIITGFTTGVINSYIAIQDNLPRRLENRWKIEVDVLHEPVINREKQAKPIVCYHYVSGKTMSADNSFEASLLVGVSFSTILFNANGKTNKVKLINGWLVWFRQEPIDIPFFSKEDIEASIRQAKKLALRSLEKYEIKKHDKGCENKLVRLSRNR